MDVHVDRVLKKTPSLYTIPGWLVLLITYISMCQLMVANIENKVYVAIRLVLVMHYNWCSLMVGFVESQNTPLTIG